MLKFLGDIFITSPYLALVPGVILGGLYYWSRMKLIGATAFLWALYAFYETLNLMRITCSGECNIRIDLILMYPILLLMTISSLGAIIKVFMKRS
ncbi:MAG: hypothetical protein AAB691_04860 [Patescibacteria group bacterium]